MYSDAAEMQEEKYSKRKIPRDANKIHFIHLFAIAPRLDEGMENCNRRIIIRSRRYTHRHYDKPAADSSAAKNQERFHPINVNWRGFYYVSRLPANQILLHEHIFDRLDFHIRVRSSIEIETECV